MARFRILGFLGGGGSWGWMNLGVGILLCSGLCSVLLRAGLWFLGILGYWLNCIFIICQLISSSDQIFSYPSLGVEVLFQNIFLPSLSSLLTFY